MAILTSPRSVPLVLAAAFVLAGCSSSRIDPLEFDYYSNDRDADTASYTPNPAPTSGRAETAPIVPIGRAAAEATATTAATTAATTVTVQKGDSLYGLSARHLGSGKRWPEIARLNGLSDADIKRLSVGRELKLPPR